MCASSWPPKFGGRADFLPRPAAVDPRRAALVALGIDEEGGGVVQLVVQASRVGIVEPEAQAEATVGERQSLGVEADRELATFVPAELRRVLHAAGEQQPALAAHLVRQARRPDRLLGDEPDAQGE